MAVFLGMGLGVALGRRYPYLFEWVFPALLVLAAVLALSKQVGLMDLGFPDPSISLWGADVRMVSFGQFCLATLVVVGLFWLVTLAGDAGVFAHGHSGGLVVRAASAPAGLYL
jgi:hypothetical protein